MHTRGRSREVSRAAEARRASEERRRHRQQRSCALSAVATTGESIPQRTSRPTTTRTMKRIEETRFSQIAASELQAGPPVPRLATITTRSFSMADDSSLYAPSLTSDSDSLSPPLTASDVDFCDYFYCESPPSPPHTIEDQLHVAYAHDDIHLAKILLLKLKGIEVNSDDDPRIAAVQDEDFDEAFLPHGALLTDEEERRAKEAHRQEQERRQRQSWERRCQRIWENEKMRLQEDKLRIKAAKARAEEERRLRQKEQQRSSMHKTKLSYTALPQSHTRAPSSSSSLLSIPPPTLDLPPRRKRSRAQTPAPQSFAVSFEETLSAMEGPLFPISNAERGQTRAASSISTLTRQGTSLHPLDVLLDAEILRREPDERIRRRRNADAPRCLCRTQSWSSLSSPSDTDNSGSSFSSVSSAFTDVSTPSTSLESASHMQPPKRLVDVSDCHRCSAAAIPTTRLAAVPCDTHPLTPDSPTPRLASPIPAVSQPRTSRNQTKPAASNTRFGRLIQLAKGFQNAYMQAMVYSVMPTADLYPQTIAHADESKIISSNCLPHLPLPEGYRASPAHVRVFLEGLAELDSDSTILPSSYVCLDGAPRRTTLPYSAQPTRIFEKSMAPMPSPMQRFYHQTYLRERCGVKGMRLTDIDADLFGQMGKRPYVGSGGPRPRLRIIQNPVLMQYKALKGAVKARGGTLDSPGLKRGPMAMGQEKMLSYTIEWNRRSLLCPNTQHSV
ncbi:hypothetical protein CYLTODRAFT_485585 [Cylindrobasidium torrendii FP15055 ss-10]|uniref:Uncharacterized protein n=1 Tax=Cylindrobasidium torrendii FP15055 ss-10 TaxID=1314674 RepID=A0A0D7BT54_9AGAR|nr:hypothetical protein CYLTODRAFT_485585 [Cylindrobasidium torrendii FP15055 ss-10]